MPRRLLLPCLLVVLAACSQDEGEPCQKNGDCADGLECVIARGSERGTCEKPGSADAPDTELDGGADRSADELEMRLGASDAGGGDAGLGDAGVLDLDAAADDDAG